MIISDPDMVQDLFTTRNNVTDKFPLHDLVFKDMLGNSLLLGKGDDIWKAKRKACAHAFYKEQLKIMMDVEKDIIEHYIDDWNSKIEQSDDNHYFSIDIAV